MKRKNIKYFLGAAMMFFVATSCEDKLDINDNPNQATEADVNLVLPQAIVASAGVASSFNNYGAHFGGYMANAGGFSGFGNLLSYNLTPNDWNGLWVQTYQDPLTDLQYVINTTEGVEGQEYYNAAAKIMSVVNYQRLVDTFGNIPYSEALKAADGITTPAYDDAFTVYQSLYATLDEAIALIQASDLAQPLTEAADPLFDGDIDQWAKYANTLKLRMLIRLSSKSDFASFVSSGFSSLDLGLGFIDDDAIVDPGYELNKPNPAWNTWGRNPAGNLANSSRIPTSFAFGFYSGAKIVDLYRGEASFTNYGDSPSTPHNQLGNEDGSPPVITNQVTWQANDDIDGIGILKGPGMGQPLMLKAEALFLIAEAQARGFMGAVNITDVNGDVVAVTDAEAFDQGIMASIAYLYKDEEENVIGDPETMFDTYLNANETNPLVNYSLTTSATEKQEAIVTQKWIAVNMINSDEGYNEYRRTGFPESISGGGPAFDIASNKSTITSRPDRLPTRVLYPSSEQSFNATNYVTVDYTSELIFWDPN